MSARIVFANIARPVKVTGALVGIKQSGVSSLALCTALLLAGMPAQASAQTTTPEGGPSTNVPNSPNPDAAETPGTPDVQATEDEPEGDVVVVTGFRAAIANAIAEKRRSDQIVESISSEDIGKLPDNSIAESIARLPGLTAQRVDGRDQVISIRGFAPDFSTTLLNGREQVTTGDNRAVEFDQYPSELLGQVVVYKTPSAGLVGQGISGTIDLRTVRPLQYGRRVLAGSVRGELVTKGKLNAGSKDKGFRVSSTYIDQFADDTIGVTFGVAHSRSPSQYERFNAWGYPTFDCGARAEYQVAGGGACNSTFAPAQGKFIIGGAKPFVQSNMLTRTGVVGTVQWEPVDALTLTVDGLYTNFKEEQALRGIEFPLWWGNATLQPGFTTDDRSVTSGTWTDVKGVLRNDYVERKAKIMSGGFNAKYEKDAWTFIGDASYSSVKRDDVYIETYAGTSRFTQNGPYDTLGFQTESDGITTFNSTLDYADPDLIFLTSPQGWANGPRPGGIPGGQDGFYSAPSIDDSLYAIRGSAQYEFSDELNLEVGANYTARTKEYVPTSLFLATQANIDDPTHSTSVRVPDQYYLGTTDLSYLGIPGQVSFDPQALVRDGILVRLEAANEPTAFNTWDLDENVMTGWARFGFNRPMGAEGRLSGNAGVQIVRTDQSSRSFANLTGTPTPNDDGRTYTHILPSLNLSFRFDEQNVLRVGVARTLARARMDQLKASINFGTNSSLYTSTDPFSGFFSAGGGNPRLKPWVARGIDVSYERYLGPNAYIAAAAFYKKLETYIYDQKVLFDFTGATYNPPQGGSPTPGTFLGVITQPVNGKGGKLYGGELSASLPFSLFSDALDGFGVLGSYSYTKSKIVANPGNPSQPLPGLSKHVANATMFYEKNGFSARASLRKRSKFLAEVISLGPGARNRLARGETVVDAQIGYEFKDGPMKGLGLLVQGQNLTSEPFVTEDSGNKLIIDSQDYGRRFLAGISFKY